MKYSFKVIIVLLIFFNNGINAQVITPITFFGVVFNPQSIAFDATGNLFVANDGGQISKLSTNGKISGFAVLQTTLSGLVIDKVGNIYVSDQGHYEIKKINKAGVITVFATGLNNPQGIAFDAIGNLFVVNKGNNSISKITPNGVVSSFATGLNNPDGIAIDSDGNLFISNSGNNTISKITRDGIVSTFISTGLNNPTALIFDGSGNLYVSNSGDGVNGNICKITKAGLITVYVKTGLDYPHSLSFDKYGKLYVANTYNSTIGKIADDGTFTIVIHKNLRNFHSLVVDSHDNIYTCNEIDSTLYIIGKDGKESTSQLRSESGIGQLLFEKAGNLYSCNLDLNKYPILNKIQTNGIVCGLNSTSAIALDDSNNLYVARSGKVTSMGIINSDKQLHNFHVPKYSNSTISKISKEGKNTLFVDSGLYAPSAIVFDQLGNLLVANDGGNYSETDTKSGSTYMMVKEGFISKVTKNGKSTKLITFHLMQGKPKGLAFDKNGNLFITVGNSIKKVTSEGIVSTLVEKGLDSPSDIAFSKSGNLYVITGGCNLSKVAL